MRTGIVVQKVIVCLIMIGGYEAFLGFRQLYGFSVSNHSLYAYTDPSLRSGCHHKKDFRKDGLGYKNGIGNGTESAFPSH